jgi:hypothetical protein
MQISSHLGWTITRGSLGIFESCANGKAKQKNVPKKSNGDKATVSMAGDSMTIPP